MQFSQQQQTNKKIPLNTPLQLYIIILFIKALLKHYLPELIITTTKRKK